MSIKRVLCSVDLQCIRGFLTPLYHTIGRGRKPYPPVSMLKAQLLRHLWRVPSDRRLALLLKRNRRVARACGFKRETPSHGLFTQFRHRLGKDGYAKVFSTVLEQLLKDGAVKGEVVALDSTAVKAYSQRSLYNFRIYYIRQRKRVVFKLQNPRPKKITLHTLRHFYATMLYHKTRDLLQVKEKLGHRSITSTMIYTHLVNFESDEYIVRRPRTAKQEDELIQAGFDYVRFDDKEQAPIYRKRK